jgi:hypothetical protein
VPADDGQFSLADRVRETADPAIAKGHTPFEVRALVWVTTGIRIGPGGHSDPCAPPVCPYCGACGQGSGHGGCCPNG